jgi:hypothetical protein
MQPAAEKFFKIPKARIITSLVQASQKSPSLNLLTLPALTVKTPIQPFAN